MTHTPGPWFKSSNLVEAGPSIIIEQHGNVPIQEKRANAALIAAAPELLEALEEWLSEGRFMSGNSDEKNALVSKTRAVITKAKPSS